MDDPHRTLPRSVVLALWLAHVPASRTDLRRAVAAVQGDDEPHVIEGLGKGAVKG